MPAPTRWLIGHPAQALPERVFLHVFDDGEAEAEMDWLPCRGRALRFGSAEAAQAFVALHRLAGAEASEHPLSELDQPAPHPFDRAVAVA